MSDFNKIDWVTVASKIVRDYPFVNFTINNNVMETLCVGDFKYVLTIEKDSKPNSVTIMAGTRSCNYSNVFFGNVDLLATILIQTITELPAFQMQYIMHETKKLLAPLEKRIEELHTMISYAPDGPGYERAKAHFEKLI